MPRGFDLSKGPNQKTFGTKGTISAKQKSRGFDLSKGPNQKTFDENKGTISARQKPRGFDLLKGLNQKPSAKIKTQQVLDKRQKPSAFQNVQSRNLRP